MRGSPNPLQESNVEAFNAAVKQAAEAFFGGNWPLLSHYTRSYLITWLTCSANNPPPDYVLRDFFAERGFEPKEVVVSTGGCSIFFTLDTVNQES
jgi:hypothetical protein